MPTDGVRHPRQPARTLHGASPRAGTTASFIGSLRPRPRSQDENARRLWLGFGDAWTAVSYLLCGIVIWGGLGFGLDKLLGTAPALAIAGVLVGNAGGVYLIWLRLMKNTSRDHAA